MCIISNKGHFVLIIATESRSIKDVHSRPTSKTISIEVLPSKRKATNVPVFVFLTDVHEDVSFFLNLQSAKKLFDFINP